MLEQLLVCPNCKGELRRDARALFCEHCRLKFRIIEGIPDMLHSEKF